MPFAEVNGLRLWYDVRGDGTPLCLIEGLGQASWLWHYQVAAFSERHRLVMYDNRDVGRSDHARLPYRVRDLADDLVGLLDAVGIARTHILGVSMGGFVAQEFALAYPGRLAGLVLVATAFGGPEMVALPIPARRRESPDSTLSPEERLRQAMEIAFAPGFSDAHPEVAETLVRLRLDSVQPREAWLRQAGASLGFDVSARLHAVTAPTLILHGQQDRVVPVENARLLAQRIPRAELQLRSGGHLCFAEDADTFNQLVLDFLDRVDAQSA